MKHIFEGLLTVAIAITSALPTVADIPDGRSVPRPTISPGREFWGSVERSPQCSYCNFQTIDLRNADLIGADLSRADLKNADLRGAELSGANLEEADLTGANLQGADLRRANLRNADFRQADLTGANWEGANPEEAKSWCGAKLPNGEASEVGC